MRLVFRGGGLTLSGSGRQLTDTGYGHAGAQSVAARVITSWWQATPMPGIGATLAR
jgi:hypothetical protein